MPTIEDEKRTREALKKLTNDIINIQIDQLVQRDRLGNELNFEEAIPYFERIINLFKKLESSSIEHLPFSILQSFINSANEASKIFAAIKSFSPKQGNAFQARTTLITQLQGVYENNFAAVGPYVASFLNPDKDVSTYGINARQIIVDMQEAKAEQSRLFEAVKKETNDVLDSVRKAAAEGGVSQHSSYFKKEASEHERTARYWLIANLLLGAGTIAFALYSINYYSSRDLLISTPQAIQLGVAKIIAFSILSFGMILTSRNYRAHRHNFVINKHRQNALSTFKEFVSATGDETTKNVVLIKATEAIFSPGVTGYLTKEPESQGGTQVLEIIKDAMGKRTE